MSKAITGTDNVSSKISKLLPAEVTALYIALRPLVAGGNAYIHLLTAIACVIATIAFIKMRRGVSNKLHIAAYTFTFMLWLLALEPAGFELFLNQKWGLVPLKEEDFMKLGGIGSITWTFVVANFFALKTSDELAPASEDNPQNAPDHD